ncbi:MAG: DUF1439 domain-containing protein [Pseudomonadota bacterium]
MKAAMIKYRFFNVSLAVTIAMSLWLAGCATVAVPRQVTVTVEQLQQSLARKFPLNQRYLDLVNVKVSNPRLQLQPNTNRVTTTLDAAVSPVLATRQMTGSFTLSGVPAIDTARNAVVLREPRMEKLTLDGVDEALTLQLAKIGDALAQKILADVPIHQFDPAQLRLAGVQYIPTLITTTPQAIMVTFEPMK